MSPVPPRTEAEHVLSVSRLIAAPPAEVYRVWTERIAEWWAPAPWTTEVRRLELRPGGTIAMTMRGDAPDEVSPVDGVVLEAVPGERILFTDAFSEGWRPQPPFMVGAFTFEAEGDGTRYAASARHWDAETCRRHEEMGFDEGWGMCADQLKALVESGR
jgi:uncharacterized protein YndB with AHSA1/START domain